jgi:hypothetical protein
MKAPVPIKNFRSGFCAVPVFGIAVLILTGCSEGGPKTVEVSGRVTWNGAPLADGHINFEAADGSPVEDHVRIVDGTYRFRARPGKKIVRIHADRGTGKIDPAMKQEIREAYIPERYGTASQLRVDVTADGKNQWDFDLKGEP